jgi:hypothetical protein
VHVFLATVSFDSGGAPLPLSPYSILARISRQVCWVESSLCWVEPSASHTLYGEDLSAGGRFTAASVDSEVIP